MKKVIFIFRHKTPYGEFTKLIDKILMSVNFKSVTIESVVASDNGTAGWAAWREFKASGADILVLGDYMYLEDQYPHLVFKNDTDPQEFLDNLLIASCR